MIRGIVNLLLCIVLANCFSSRSFGLTIPASEDTTGSAGKLILSSGAATALTVDPSRTAYLYFDLSDIPSDAVVRWAKLRLFLPSVRAKGAGLGVHFVTSQWNEALASNQPTIGIDPIGVIQPEKLGTRRFVTVDVTSAVQGWINDGTTNEGLAIAPIRSGGSVATVMLTSKEGPTMGLPAELDIEFKPDFAGLPAPIQQYFSPAFTSQPSVSVSEGVIKAEVSGLGPIGYQWYKNGVAVTGGTGAALPLVGISSGTYTLLANNGFATVRSGSLQYVSPPSVGALVLIPAGNYQLGNVTNDSDIYDAPIRTVNLSQYHMAVNDTTKAQWDQVRTWATTNGYGDLASGEGKASNHPVVSVSWYDAVKWANAASERDGLTPCYRVENVVYRSGSFDNVTCNWACNGYRLPTEAEWEAAARGGLLSKRFPWGDTILQTQANYAASQNDSYDLSGLVNDYHPAYKSGDFPFTSPVETFAANGYGLYDVTGNVSQWCWDWSGDHSGGENPRGPSTGSFRSLRGGSWWKVFNVIGAEGGASAARIARRHDDYAFGTMQHNGFRVVRGRLQ